MTTQNKYLINTLMIHIHKINTKILIRAITEINNLLNPVKEKSKYQIYKASNIDCQKKIIAVGRGKISTYHISSYSFHRNYSFLNLEIVANSNSCRNISIFLLNKLNFCCRNYSREETIQGRKLYEEIQYMEFFQSSP